MHVLVAYDIRRVALCIKIQHAMQMLTTVSIRIGAVFVFSELNNEYDVLIMYNVYISKKAEKIIKDVNATMALEGMPLSDFDIELISKVVDGEITREEAFRQLNASLGIDG